MARIPLLAEREGLSDAQQSVFDWIESSRGAVQRPFQVLLHVPEMARPTAELGHEIRYEGSLSDHDRELAIITVASAHGCQFEWDTHVVLARKAHVSEATIAALNSGADVDGVEPADRMIVGFARQLCSDSNVSEELHAAATERFGTATVVELSTLIGYYTLLAFVMNAAGAG